MKMIGDIMKVSIKEIFDDLYKLAQEDGYMSALCNFEPNDDEIHEFFITNEEITLKYIPNYKKFIRKDFDELDDYDKACALLELNIENFREIIYGLMYQGGKQ